MPQKCLSNLQWTALNTVVFAFFLLVMSLPIIHFCQVMADSNSNDYTDRSQALNTTSLTQLTTQLQLQSVSFNDTELCLETERHFSDELGLLSCKVSFFTSGHSLRPLESPLEGAIEFDGSGVITDFKLNKGRTPVSQNQLQQLSLALTERLTELQAALHDSPRSAP